MHRMHIAYACYMHGAYACYAPGGDRWGREGRREREWMAVSWIVRLVAHRGSD